MRALVVVALAGCSQWFGLDEPSHTTDATIAIDGAPLCLGADKFRVCLDSRPTTTLDLSGTLDTTTACPLVIDVNGAMVCVLAGSNVTVAQSFTAQGTLPIVVFAVGNVSIDGTLDVASHHGNPLGAGGNPPACPALVDGISSAAGGGGGAGGSFGSIGGNGGDGDIGQAKGATAMAGMFPLETLHGGCHGSRGGAGSSVSQGAGDGGGGVYVLAGGAITIAGTVNASGGGGSGGTASKGGGAGGGSGGMILLSAPTIAFSGTLMANGGGGGGGADNAAVGNAGEDPSDYAQAAQGGLGGATTCGATPGCGGDGAIQGKPATNGGADGTGAGGGGGGGGLGMIRVLSGQQLMGKISPQPTMM